MGGRGNYRRKGGKKTDGWGTFAWERFCKHDPGKTLVHLKKWRESWSSGNGNARGKRILCESAYLRRDGSDFQAKGKDPRRKQISGGRRHPLR